eukprot:1958241-Pleurochrysis_carterae.AAC.1
MCVIKQTRANPHIHEREGREGERSKVKAHPSLVLLCYWFTGAGGRTHRRRRCAQDVETA